VNNNGKLEEKSLPKMSQSKPSTAAKQSEDLTKRSSLPMEGESNDSSK